MKPAVLIANDADYDRAWEVIFPASDHLRVKRFTGPHAEANAREFIKANDFKLLDVQDDEDDDKDLASAELSGKRGRQAASQHPLVP